MSNLKYVLTFFIFPEFSSEPNGRVGVRVSRELRIRVKDFRISEI